MLKEVNYTRLFWQTLAIVTIIRIVYVILFPFDLSGDEAYYWDWGRQLSWGYFSKPPMIAWLMAFAGFLGGNTDIGIRLMAVALGTGSLIFLFQLGKIMFSERVGFWIFLLTLATPANVALTLIFTIDAPLMFCWSAALLTFYLQITDRKRAGFWALLTTLSLGVGLLSKQMMFAFHALMVATAIFCAPYRFMLKKLDLWIPILVSLLFLVPTILWNAANDWITISHTQHHFEGEPITFLDTISRAGEFLGSQLGVLSPVMYVAVLGLLFGIVKLWPRLDSKARYLALFSAPGLIFVLLMLFRQEINPNWPGVFYPGIMLLLAAAICASPDLPEKWQQLWPKWKKATLYTGFAFVIFTMSIPWVLIATQQTGLKGIDPLVRLQGWERLSETIQEYREDQEDPLILTVGHRYLASHLAFYLPDQPKVYRWPSQPGYIDSQYELWGLPDEFGQRDTFIIVDGEDVELPESLLDEIRNVEKIETIAHPGSHKRIRHYTLYTAKGH